MVLAWLTPWKMKNFGENVTKNDGACMTDPPCKTTNFWGKCDRNWWSLHAWPQWKTTNVIKIDRACVTKRTDLHTFWEILAPTYLDANRSGVLFGRFWHLFGRKPAWRTFWEVLAPIWTWTLHGVVAVKSKVTSNFACLLWPRHMKAWNEISTFTWSNYVLFKNF